MLIDTHCHIHESDYPLDADEVITRAHQAGVMQMICVGTDEVSSREAIKFASGRDGIFASVGVHPHYAEKGIGDLGNLVHSVCTIPSENGFTPGSTGAKAPSQTRVADVFSNEDTKQNPVALERKLVAIGEIGLDYYKNTSSKESQEKILREQIEIALKYDLPIIFHIREAFDDFWPIFDSYEGIRGVLHCFTDSIKNTQEGMKRGLFIGINGISTFTKDEQQKAMFASLPMDKIILETDAPLLTPSPFRGTIKVNEPAFVREIAEHCGAIHQITLDEVANITTTNAITLFKV